MYNSSQGDNLSIEEDNIEVIFHKNASTQIYNN